MFSASVSAASSPTARSVAGASSDGFGGGGLSVNPLAAAGSPGGGELAKMQGMMDSLDLGLKGSGLGGGGRNGGGGGSVASRGGSKGSGLSSGLSLDLDGAF